MKQYEIWVAELPSLPESHIQRGRRPVIIVSNGHANAHSPVVTVVPLTSRPKKSIIPTHVAIRNWSLDKTSLALCEQVMPLDKHRLLRRVGYLHGWFEQMAIQHALSFQLGLAA